MSSRKSFTLDRRSVLAGLGAGAGSLAMPRMSFAQDGELDFWWWGEQELPGLQSFVKKAVASFEGGTVTPLLQDTSAVITQFQTAAAAKEAPDVQYFWNGIYHMESVWLGYVQPVSGLVSQDVIDASSPTILSRYGGETYRVGWYPIPMLWYYNKAVFEAAGLDPENPPTTWDAFLAACEAIRSIGKVPFGGGIQDGYFGEWYLAHALVQNLDNAGQALQLFTGGLDFREPRFYEHWSRLAELRDAGFINPSISSIELYPGIDLIVAGEIAMGPSIGTRLPADSAATSGQIGVMTMPVYGTGAMAGKPILDVQGLGISAGTENPELAARFLEHLHAPEQLALFWEETGWLPSNANFDASVIEDPAVADLWQRWGLSENIPHVANLTPGQFYEQAMVPVAQRILANEIGGEEAGEIAAGVVEEWRAFNPDLLESYEKWAEDLT
ncbi:ABC transporter substrate-binding protein [Frigidibacter sp. ROC022]|uniref:ABC transporter substrate-binding protein n=1 Tax=Frigidibacter sp. ROC022 TaxID=2971796 RepID=UPI00215B43E1|nr:extracellular solute-binding protein [Frigidibacter sp. ROC022]MCR8724632.1 extracellular solute-binding protein [Frigidibacter sp. ROC022]